MINSLPSSKKEKKKAFLWKPSLSFGTDTDPRGQFLCKLIALAFTGPLWDCIRRDQNRQEQGGWRLELLTWEAREPREMGKSRYELDCELRGSEQNRPRVGQWCFYIHSRGQSHPITEKKNEESGLSVNILDTLLDHALTHWDPKHFLDPSLIWSSWQLHEAVPTYLKSLYFSGKKKRRYRILRL